MALILDTNALAAFADGDPDLAAVLEDEPDLAVPAIVLGEYLFGVWKSIHRKRYEEWLGANESLFRILAVRQATARHYAAIRFELKEAGRPIPTNDLWIAALCREYRSKLVSRDRHFAAVTGLTVVVW